MNVLLAGVIEPAHGEHCAVYYVVKQVQTSVQFLSFVLVSCFHVVKAAALMRQMCFYFLHAMHSLTRMRRRRVFQLEQDLLFVLPVPK